VEVFCPQGTEPLKSVGVKGRIKRDFNKELKGYAMLCDGGPTSRLEFPDGKAAKALALTQRFLALQLWLPVAGEAFSLELSLLDSGKTRRRVVISSGFRGVVANPLHVQLPLGAGYASDRDWEGAGLVLPRGQWMTVCLDLQELVSRTFVGINHRALDSVVLSGHFQLRRLFTLKEAPAGEGAAPLPRALAFPAGVEAPTIMYRLADVQAWAAREGAHVPVEAPMAVARRTQRATSSFAPEINPRSPRAGVATAAAASAAGAGTTGVSARASASASASTPAKKPAPGAATKKALAAKGAQDYEAQRDAGESARSSQPPSQPPSARRSNQQESTPVRNHDSARHASPRSGFDQGQRQQQQQEPPLSPSSPPSLRHVAAAQGAPKASPAVARSTSLPTLSSKHLEAGQPEAARQPSARKEKSQENALGVNDAEAGNADGGKRLVLPAVLRAAERRREEQQRQLELDQQQQQQRELEQQERQLEQQQQQRHQAQELLRKQREAEEEAEMEEERLRRDAMEDESHQGPQEHLEPAADEQEQEQEQEHEQEHTLDDEDEDGEDEVRRAEAQALLDAEDARLAADEAAALAQMSPLGKQELDADDAFSVGGGAETEAASPLGRTSNTLESELAAERDQLAEMEQDLEAAEAQALDADADELELEHKDDSAETEEAATAAASAAFEQMTAQFVQASIAKAIKPDSRSSSDARPSARAPVPASARSQPAPVSARSQPAPEPGEPELDLIYDPILDCFYCPRTDKYYKKKA
jgi:hypothetical protein